MRQDRRDVAVHLPRWLWSVYAGITSSFYRVFPNAKPGIWSCPCQLTADVGRGRVQDQPPLLVSEPQCRVKQFDPFEEPTGRPGELARVGVVRTQLAGQRGPRYGGRLLQVAHPVGQPGVQVQGHRRLLEDRLGNNFSIPPLSVAARFSPAIPGHAVSPCQVRSSTFCLS